MVKTRLWIVSRPGELSNCGLQEEDGGGKEEAKDENEDGEATPAGESQVRQSEEELFTPQCHNIRYYMTL